MNISAITPKVTNHIVKNAGNAAKTAAKTGAVIVACVFFPGRSCSECYDGDSYCQQENDRILEERYPRRREGAYPSGVNYD